MFHQLDTSPLRPSTIASPSPEEASTTPEGAGNEQEGGVPSTVAMGAGVAGGIVGLIVLIAVCVCAVCLSRRIHVQVLYSDKKTQQNGGEDAQHCDARSNSTHHRDTRSTSNEVFVQPNMAYRQLPDFSHRQTMQSRNEMATGQIMWMNQSQPGRRSCDHTHENWTGKNDRWGRTSHVNVACHHGNPSYPMPPAEYEMPTQQVHTMFTSDTEDHTYDYLS